MHTLPTSLPTHPRRELLGVAFSVGEGQQSGLLVSRMHPLNVFLQLVLPLELPPTCLAHELTVRCVAQHVELQLVWSGEDLATKRKTSQHWLVCLGASFTHTGTAEFV